MIKSMRWSDDRFFIVLIKKIKSDLERSERETGMCVCVCVCARGRKWGDWRAKVEPEAAAAAAACWSIHSFIHSISSSKANSILQTSMYIILLIIKTAGLKLRYGATLEYSQVHMYTYVPLKMGLYPEI